MANDAELSVILQGYAKNPPIKANKVKPKTKAKKAKKKKADYEVQD